MSAEVRSLLNEVDVAIHKASVAHHSEILRKVADLFVGGVARFSKEQIAVFDDVLCRLIRNADQSARAELSDRLAAIENAPSEVVATLACDDYLAVAGPMLESVQPITEQRLADIASARSQKHLLLIAGRPAVGESVTDVLVDRGNAEVVQKTAENPGARFSYHGFAKLFARAKSAKSLAAAIAKRNDLPAELLPFLKLLITL